MSSTIEMYIHFAYTNFMAKTPKRPISLRVSETTLNWFKSSGPRGYQTMMNSVLEEFVRERTERAIFAAGRAQEIYRKYYAQCFWHLDRDLIIVPQNMHLVLEGLRRYGGREGLLLAEDLCQ